MNTVTCVGIKCVHVFSRGMLKSSSLPGSLCCIGLPGLRRESVSETLLGDYDEVSFQQASLCGIELGWGRLLD